MIGAADGNEAYGREAQALSCDGGGVSCDVRDDRHVPLSIVVYVDQRDEDQAAVLPQSVFIATSFNLDAFKTVIANFNIFSYFGSTLIITLTSTVLLVVLAMFASYAFSKLRFRGKRGAYLAVIATMFLPGQVSLIPAYVMFSRFGLIDNYWSVILTYLAGGLPSAILLANGAISGIPNELVECGRIDGAGYFATVRNVIFPLSLSSVAIIIIFNFISSWNDLLTPMLYLSSSGMQTVMVALVGLVQRTSSQPTTQLAGLILSVLPTVIVYLFLQKYMIKGMMVGSIK